MKKKFVIILSVLFVMTFGVAACTSGSYTNRGTDDVSLEEIWESLEADKSVEEETVQEEPEEPKTKSTEREEPKAQEMEKPEKSEAEESTQKAGEDEYILPNSSTKKLTENDLKDLDAKELKLARNEIYARHGRKFDSEDLQKYFNSKSWYTGKIAPADFDESVFSKIEKYNIDYIVAYENGNVNSNSGGSSGTEMPHSQTAPSGNTSQPQQTPQQPSAASGSNNAVICKMCGGLGHCPYCIGGQCSYCNGSRKSMCAACVGLGRCGKCGGDGYYYTGVGISFTQVTCSSCNGLKKCGTCGGTGEVACMQCGGTGSCTYCYGIYTCSYCSGLGYLPQ